MKKDTCILYDSDDKGLIIGLFYWLLVSIIHFMVLR